MKIRITQDSQAHATYIDLRQSREVKHSHTVELPNGWNVDYDTDGNIRGIEVLFELVETLLLDDITDRKHDATGGKGKKAIAEGGAS